MVISRRINIGEFAIRSKRTKDVLGSVLKDVLKDVLKSVLKRALKTALTVADVSAYLSKEGEHEINPPMKVKRELCT